MLSPSEMLCSTFPERWFLCRQNHLPGNLDSQGPPTRKKTTLSGGKTKKKLPNFFLRLWDTYKKYILQKNWVKTAIPALSSDQSNLHPPIYKTETLVLLPLTSYFRDLPATFPLMVDPARPISNVGVSWHKLAPVRNLSMEAAVETVTNLRQRRNACKPVLT